MPQDSPLDMLLHVGTANLTSDTNKYRYVYDDEFRKQAGLIPGTRGHELDQVASYHSPRTPYKGKIEL